MNFSIPICDFISFNPVSSRWLQNAMSTLIPLFLLFKEIEWRYCYRPWGNLMSRDFVQNRQVSNNTLKPKQFFAFISLPWSPPCLPVHNQPNCYWQVNFPILPSITCVQMVRILWSVLLGICRRAGGWFDKLVGRLCVRRMCVIIWMI